MSSAEPPRRASLDPVGAAIAATFSAERAAVLATLIRHVGDFQLAEDAVQDAFADAVSAWRRGGVPARPGAWLTVAARRRAIDRMRRNRSVANRADRLAELMRLDRQEHPDGDEDSAIVDDRLRLIFTCCHPALDLPARVGLTLRALGGLTTGEIAPSPVVDLNRAAAVGLAVGPQAGLELLEPLLADPALERYQPLHAAHADLLRRAGDSVAAARAYERAIALSANEVERAELHRRLSTLAAD